MIALLDNTGKVVVKYRYDAWGKCQTTVTDDNASMIAELNPFRYRSYYYDTETGFYFLQTRYYDPEIGRFMTIDDISYLDPESINGLNLYAYCLNNPVMHADPSGCFAFTTALLLSILIGAAVGALTGATINGVTYLIQYGGTDSFSWRAFGATVAGGAVSGLITGGIAGAASILGGPALGIFVTYTLAGFTGGLLGSIVENAILGNMSTDGIWGKIMADALWGAAGGALGGLMQGAITPVKMLVQKTGKPLGKVLEKAVRNTVKDIGPSLVGGILSDFLSWYSRFMVERTSQSYMELV